ncbi:MAG: ribose-phosphate pyrophosphokinase, partial [Candidatus Levybacteria bacterium]|nr:ribose-phosphate pyrophosphokinase [Candidatus Levybacteria bacterium]
GNALKLISSSAIDEVIITDTVYQSSLVLNNKKITVVTVAPLLAEAIRRIETGESISKDLIL